MLGSSRCRSPSWHSWCRSSCSPSRPTETCPLTATSTAPTSATRPRHGHADGHQRRAAPPTATAPPPPPPPPPPSASRDPQPAPADRRQPPTEQEARDRRHPDADERELRRQTSARDSPRDRTPMTRLRRARARPGCAVLATVGADGAPHLVPVVFAVARRRVDVYTAVDAKRRPPSDCAGWPTSPPTPGSACSSTTTTTTGRSCGGCARTVLRPFTRAARRWRSATRLREKYPQYERVALDGPVVTVDVDRWASWRA